MEAAVDTARDRPSFWSTEALRARPALDRDLDVDVIVLGGGLTGLTSAWLLAQAGVRVALVERHTLASGDTGHTTAHLTVVTDARPRELVELIGVEDAAALWAAGRAGLAEIERLATSLSVSCDLKRVPATLHVPFDLPAEDEAELGAGLKRDAELAREWGVDAAFVEEVPLVGRPGVRFDDQAIFHPTKYLRGIAEALVTLGVPIHEHSEAGFTDNPEVLECRGHRIRARWVVMATHNPLSGRQGFAAASRLQTRLSLYTTHAVRARLPGASLHAGLYWDTGDPYRYLRIEEGPDGWSVIAGGEDHKTGQAADTRVAQAALGAWLHRLLPRAEITHRWSGQVIETPDGAPFIGEVADRQWIATGFAGNGMTFGTLAAMMVRDAVTGVANPWSRVVSPERAAALRAPWEYIRENADFPYYLMKRLFGRHAGRALHDIRHGEGAVVSLDGQSIAAARDPEGRLHLRSAICTHMGCEVAWNSSDRTWDCPCHGSRFTASGDVISGPAERPLDEPEPGARRAASRR